MAEDKLPDRADPTSPAARRSEPGEVTAFLKQARAVASAAGKGRGRLLLALDATMSRQPTWDLARRLQADMFDAVGRIGTLSVQLVYFRGLGECRASRFVTDTDTLKSLMGRIDCQGGHTQIGKVLKHALETNAAARIEALVYIGDAVEENIDDLAVRAGELGLHGVPVFVFQEGGDAHAEQGFREIARLSKGAWFRFDRSAAATLSELLSSVAVYAAGGIPALEARGRATDRQLLEHLKGSR